MLPGPDQIVACPNCEALAKYETLMSGNTFGARVWTDGKRVAPMMTQPPAVVKCHRCAECYWLADARDVGMVGPWGDESRQIDADWAAAPLVQEPTEAEYYKALQDGFAADSQQERTLRILAWWRRNDGFRTAPRAEAVSAAAVSGPSRRNLEALARLMDEADENDRLMKAEVLRELGEFESAIHVLNRVTSAEHAAVVRQLHSLCDAGDVAVREVSMQEEAADTQDSGGAFDPDDDTYHEALDRLRLMLIDLGFHVHRKRDRETTLRVYLDRETRYPLLNPRWIVYSLHDEPDCDGAEPELMPVLDVKVYSRGDTGGLDECLKRFVSDHTLVFVPAADSPRGSGNYTRHGSFVMSVLFVGEGADAGIDFDALEAPWWRIREHLLRS